MKTLVFISLLAFVIMTSFSSCDKSSHEPDLVFYNLALNFQDALGNDLVNGIGLDKGSNSISEEQAQTGYVKRELYTLNIIASQPCEDVIDTKTKHFKPDDPQLGMKRFNDCCYLTNDFGLFTNDCPEEKKLTYRLKCPSVFGDETEHEFVTYWEIPVLQNKFAKAICTRIEFEGKVFTPTLTQDGYSYRVTIILEDVTFTKIANLKQEAKSFFT
jgi:hypothetical protein